MGKPPNVTQRILAKLAIRKLIIARGSDLTTILAYPIGTTEQTLLDELAEEIITIVEEVYDMNIDATIKEVRDLGPHIALVLEGEGPAELIILNSTRLPIAGQTIWGDSNLCVIEPGHWEYTLAGKVVLQEVKH